MIAGFLMAIVGAMMLAHYAMTLLFLRRLRHDNLSRGVIGHPRITLLRPVCGLDNFDRETLASSFLQHYPDYEIIFCAPREDDAAVSTVRELIALYPGVKARVIFGLDAISGNPKLNNLFKGWLAATSEWICMADSNLLLPTNYLQCLVSAWGPRTGLVTSPAVGIRPQSFGAHVECAFLNGNQARLQFTADSLGIGFAQGKTLFWNKAELERAGGLRILGGRLAEDVTATRTVRARGQRVNLTRLPFAQPLGVRSLRLVWERQLRWSRVRRDGFPLLFAGEVINGSLLATGLFALGISALGWPVAATVAFLFFWYLPEVLLMKWAQWPCGWKDVAALPVRDLMMPALFATTFRQRGIEWRGNPMSIPTTEQTHGVISVPR